MNTRINKIIAVALILALGPVVADANPVEWPEAGPDNGNGHFYEFVVAPGISWDAAQTAANSKVHNGIVGHLATLTTTEEDDFVDGERDTAALGQAWIGGSQLDNQSTPGDGWSWLNGDGPIPGVDTASPYANWGDNAAASDVEPNDAGGMDFPAEENLENHLALGRYGVGGGWNDESPGNIAGYIVEYDSTNEAFANPGTNQLFFGSSGVPGSPNPLTAAYQEVLPGGGGAVTIHCCRVLDVREGAGSGKGKYGDYDPVNLDIGAQFDALDESDNPLNPTCADMPDIGSDVFVLRPWQRGIPESMASSSDGSARLNDLGACVVLSTAITKGVFFTEEAPENVLGFSLKYAEELIEYRPYTGGVAFNPGEIDAPYVVRWSAETNKSRSAKRGSDNGFILNLRHYSPHNDTKAYLSRMAGNLLDSIEYERSRVENDGTDGNPIVPPLCVDNTAFFLDDLFDLLTTAKDNFAKKGSPATSEMYLDYATRLALLLTYTGPGDPYDVDPDPPGMVSSDACPGNPKGVFVGRLMALKHANCSERIQAGEDGLGTGDNAKSNSDGTGNCEIATDIRDALPPLP